MTSEFSMLKPLGYQKRTSCGYCKSTDGNSAYYMQCEQMRVDHYQELMDRGWRRSGSLYYKPDLPRSCCPHYTIRLKASEFQARRDQRKAINRWNNNILGLEYKHNAAMLCPKSREEKRQKRDKFILHDAVNDAIYPKVKRPTATKSKKPVEPAHKFEVNVESDSFTKEKYKIFLKYQTEIHKDPVSRWKEAAFKRFLCTGLDQKTVRTNGKTQKFGSYHQCYRIDGRLVAVGVLDLLPHAVSSVYLFYDPEFEQWDFGKISALHEIELAAEQNYNYYYMGFYIHSCIKMRYKGTFSPSYLLDPESLRWDILDDEYRHKLDERKYVSLSHDRGNPPPTTAREAGVPGNDLAASSGDVAKPGDASKSSAPGHTNEQGLEFDIDANDSEEDDAEIPEGSLFDYHVPGLLTKDEVETLDLDHWKLVVRNMLVDLEDLRGWENGKIDDPNSIKGIAAELAAAVGPKLLANSAIVLF